MREIKFRVWDEQINGFSCFQNSYKLEDIHRNNNHLVFQQYTGLKDKNSVDIYEGDIISAMWNIDFNEQKEYFGVVVFTDGGFHVDFKSLNQIKWLSSVLSREVVGNIHKNKELLND